MAVPYYIIARREGLLSHSFTRLLGSDLALIRKEFASPDVGLQRVFDEISSLPYLGWSNAGEILYAAVRALRPSIVVETGVAAGLSSACILSALESNGHGELYSIDLPNREKGYLPELGVKPFAVLPEGKTTGFLVPQTLRSRWHLSLGDTREELPNLLSNLPSVNIFLHDSEHTYDMMTFEYDAAWPKLRPGGLLLSDDVSWNVAFPQFCRRQGLRPVYFWTTGLGGVAKPGRASGSEPLL